MGTHLVILAAGEGTRMQSDRPKVLHEIGGLPLFAHAIASGRDIDPDRIILVVGNGADAVQAAADIHAPEADIVVQTERLGTGHAVRMASEHLQAHEGRAVVLYGDTPFVRPETLARMAEALDDGFDIAVLGFRPEDPARYGRLVMDGDALERIVEFKDANDEERAIGLCNGGVKMASSKLMAELVESLSDDNAAGEYYLTDIVELARARGLNATAVECDPIETMGIDTRAGLAKGEAAFQAARREEMLSAGVTLEAPETVFFSHDTAIGRDAHIEPNVVFGPGVTVETGARIRAFSHLEGCHVGSGAVVGPYARLRPGAELDTNTRVGNFVEIKNATLDEGAKVNHLSYIGDASVGAKTNIGAGTITCNYDGVFKHRTEIGAEAFIGSNTMLVAPVTVGDGAMTATGTVVTRNVDPGAMAVGRARAENKPGFATRLFEKLRAQKARQKEE